MKLFTPAVKRFCKAMISDARRVIPLLILGAIMVECSPGFARWVGEPVYSAWGLWVGGAFYVGALTYIMRRMLFPTLELTPLFNKARESSTGAGLVFLGICFIMGMMFIMMNSSIQS